MPNRHPTLKDVAKLAGVSVTTASRAIASHPDVSAGTKARVQAAREMLGYRPSLLARGLASGQSLTLALLVSDITNPFYPQLARSIAEVAHQAGYVLILFNTCDNRERSSESFDRLIGLGVDGVIHASVGADEDFLHLLVERCIPLVVANRRPIHTRGLDVVVADNFGGARQATHHLVELGHQRIAFIAGPEFASVSEERLSGYRAELEENHLLFRASLVRRCDFTRHGGYEAAREILQLHPRPTAIFAVNDVVALGVMDIALDLELRIPADLSVIGFDNIEPSGLGPLRLTTISAPIREMGQIACERVLQAIRNPASYHPQATILDTHLVVRDTTGHPAMETVSSRNGQTEREEETMEKSRGP